jgi:hypothetical protein
MELPIIIKTLFFMLMLFHLPMHFILVQSILELILTKSISQMFLSTQKSNCISFSPFPTTLWGHPLLLLLVLSTKIKLLLAWYLIPLTYLPFPLVEVMAGLQIWNTHTSRSLKTDLKTQKQLYENLEFKENSGIRENLHYGSIADSLPYHTIHLKEANSMTSAVTT